MAEEDSDTIKTDEPVPIEQLIERWWEDHFPARQSRATRKPGMSPTPLRRG
jgi:hypothetical protein